MDSNFYEEVLNKAIKDYKDKAKEIHIEAEKNHAIFPKSLDEFTQLNAQFQLAFHLKQKLNEGVQPTEQGLRNQKQATLDRKNSGFETVVKLCDLLLLAF